MRIERTDRLDLIARLEVEATPWDVMGSDEAATYAWWIAFDDDDRPAAHAAAKINRHGEAYLAWAHVKHRARGKGLQLRLIRARLAWARKQGAAAAVTYTDAKNAASQCNLIRAGFMPYRPANLYAGAAAVYWQRDL